MKDASGKKQKVEFSLSSIQNNTATKRQLDGFIEEVILSKGKIKMEQEALKDIMNEAKDSLGIPRKVLLKLVKERMDPGALEAEVRGLEEVQQIAEALDPAPTAQFTQP